MDMNEAQFKGLLSKIGAAVKHNQLPEVASFSEDEKRSLRMFLPLIKNESDVEALARFLPHINTPEKVASFAFITKLGAGAIILTKAARLLASWPGLVLIALVVWLLGGNETREALSQIVEMLK